MRRFALLLVFLLMAGVTSLFGQARTITGKVTSAADGTTFPGVTVVVPGTTIGTITDLDGNYSLTVPEDATELQFKYVGMKTVIVPIEDRSVIDIQMEEDIVGLEEVVVVGYGKQLKTDLTGAISKVEPQKELDVPTPSIETALQGKTSGVHIEKSSGKLGESIKIRVRGTSSISADNQPLYVIDGMPIYTEDTGISINQPTNPLTQINFNDVESIEILKDASAAAIYGSRGANGVVIITTRSGQAGRNNIDIDYSYGVSQRSNTVGFLNAAEYRELYREAAQNYLDEGDIYGFGAADADELMEIIDAYYVPGMTTGDADVNWEEEAFRQGNVQNLNLSSSGGNEKTTYFINGSYMDQQGIIIKNDFERFSGRLNVEHKATDKLNLGGNFAISRTRLDRVSNDNAFSTPMQLCAIPSVQPKYDSTGQLNKETVYFNGLIAARDNNSVQIAWRNIGSGYFTYEIVPGLTWRSQLGLDVINQREDYYLGRRTNDGEPDGNGGSRSLTVFNLTTNHYATFTKQIGELHDIELLAGMEYQEVTRQTNGIQATGFPTDDFTTIDNATTAAAFYSTETGHSFVSYFARATYKLYNKYLLNLSIRNDGSSRFGPESRYGVFPAGSLGWIVSRESFLENVDFISFLKLRASYGVTGNAQIPDFAHLGLYGGADYAGTSGIRPWTLASPDLKWETTSQLDVGIDFAFLNNRIIGELDYYHKNTTDLLLSKTLPATSGWTSVIENIGELENKGVELVLNTVNLDGPFRWSTNINLAKNQNTILDIAGSDIISGVNRVREGEPIGVFYTRKYAGVNPDNGHALYYLEDGTKTDDYNAASNMVVGDPNPDWVGGMTNTFEFRGFDLNVVLSFVQGNEIYNGGGQYQSNQASSYFDNQTKDQMDRWQQPGDQTDVPRAVLFGVTGYEGTNPSSRYLSDGSYLRIKNVSLGYTLPRNVTDRMNLRSVRFYVAGTNLFTFTRYEGWDPEVNWTGTNRTTTTFNIVQGRDFYTAPQARTVSFGVRVGI